MLPEVTVFRLIVSVPVPVTAAPRVSVPAVAVRLIVSPVVLSTMAAVLVVRLPVLLTVMLPPVLGDAGDG